VLGLLWLIPALPFAGFVVLALMGPRMSHRAIAVIGVGSVGLSAVVFFLVAAGFLGSSAHAFSQVLWTWMQVDGLTPAIGLYFDSLSLVFVFVITFVGFLIHLYSAQYMADEEGYSRFFAYMNLFVGSMLTLVLADNLLLLFLGWEGVGLCSYLLIGFWYTDPANGRAARKAFVVTRVGDTAMIVGLFLIFNSLGSLNIQELMGLASRQWAVGSTVAVAAAALLLGGAVGKSAQLPLQTWLPDAMAGPTPVSALIHAATMVTAGVYLIARTNVLFSLAPSVQLAVGVIGAATLLLAGFSALTQSDIKRVLAYSTISQIGYMFLALGVGAWSAGVFHFMTHAFFKALLFLSAGVVILAMHHEQNMFHMGGLRKAMPLAFWSFLIGAASLSALPLVTAGFYSKDLILEEAFALGGPGVWLWAAGLVGALLTSLYSFRAVFLVFYGERRHEPGWWPDWRIKGPLVVLAFLSVVGGFIQTPRSLGDLAGFSGLLGSVLPPARGQVAPGSELVLQLLAAVVSLFGVYVAYLFFQSNRRRAESVARSSLGSALARYWLAGWGFDWLYERVFVRPVVWFARVDSSDVVNLIYEAIAWLSRQSNRVLAATETGRVSWYAAGIALGAVIVIAIGAFR
jgi:NADH-quinone oxidoreductase subunit L